MTMTTEAVLDREAEMVAQARQRADELHGTNRRTRGPMAELMAAAGFPAERLRATARMLGGDAFHGGAFVEMIGEAGRAAFAESFRTVAAQLEGLTRFVVDVDHTDRTRHADRTFVTETARVVLLATDENDATLGAAQMVAATIGDGMVLATRLVV